MTRISADRPIDMSALDAGAGGHVIDDRDVAAIEAALYSGRPLLLLGEPGSGKTQFAKAAAAALGRAFTSITLDSRTEARELRWLEDPVARLAEAQVAGVAAQATGAKALENVARARFVGPGVLWWAFNAALAKEVQKNSSCTTPPVLGDSSKGVVALIDEIDKAEPDVPNGLLEALGARRFPNPLGGEVMAGEAPLVIVASNEERPLPAAFIRRCAVHRLALPEAEEALLPFLIARGNAQMPAVPDEVLKAAARITAEDRRLAEGHRPGLAEYIDLVRAATTAAADTGTTPEAQIENLRPYFLKKRDMLQT